MESIDHEKMYSYILNNIDQILDNEVIRMNLHPDVNNITKSLMETNHTELEAYSISFFITCTTLASFWGYQLDKLEKKIDI